MDNTIVVSFNALKLLGATDSVVVYDGELGKAAVAEVYGVHSTAGKYGTVFISF